MSHGDDYPEQSWSPPPATGPYPPAEQYPGPAGYPGTARYPAPGGYPEHTQYAEHAQYAEQAHYPVPAQYPVPVPYPVVPYVPAPQANGMGVASLVLGILGLLTSFIPVVGLIAWPLTLLGLLFGGLGLRRPGNGVAIGGLVCSAIGLAVCVLWVTVFAVFGVTAA